MSNKLVRSIRSLIKLRPILPFGLPVEIGHVVSLEEDGSVRIEGSVDQLLLTSPKLTSRSAAPVEICATSGKEVSCAVLVQGSASPAFPGMPKGGFELNFKSADSWLLSVVGLRVTSLDNVHAFRRPIEDAVKRGVWQRNWALVTTAGVVEKVTFVSATDHNTKVVLSADVATPTVSAVDLTAKIAIWSSSNSFLKCISDKAMTAFFDGVLPSEGWWRRIFSFGALSPGVEETEQLWNESLESWEEIRAKPR